MNDKKFYCEQCEGTEFIEKTSLIVGRNVNVHTEWKLYECQNCKLLKIIRTELNSSETGK